MCKETILGNNKELLVGGTNLLLFPYTILQTTTKDIMYNKVKGKCILL